MFFGVSDAKLQIFFGRLTENGEFCKILTATDMKKLVLALLSNFVFILGICAQDVVELRSLAIQGNTGAQLTLGEMNLYGSGTGVNLDSALYWLHRASVGEREAALHLIRLGVRTGDADDDSGVYLAWLNSENVVAEPVYDLELQGNQYMYPYQRVVATVNNGDSIPLTCDDMKLYSKTIPLREGVNVVRVFRENSRHKLDCVIERPVVYAVSASKGDTLADMARDVKASAPHVMKRAALVVGNSAYRMGALRNPKNDAADMAARLESLGFDVMLETDVSQKGMEDAVMNFCRRVANYDVAMFFYAGHGVQVQGENYLVPVDALISSETEVKYKCMNASLMLDMLEEANVGLKIVVLDACRNNPFARSLSRGLASMNSPAGTFLAFATGPGDIALDGKNRNSPYTTAILQHIATPGISIYECFQNISEDVNASTRGHQNPWISASLRGMFYFNR